MNGGGFQLKNSGFGPFNNNMPSTPGGPGNIPSLNQSPIYGRAFEKSMNLYHRGGQSLFDNLGSQSAMGPPTSIYPSHRLRGMSNHLGTPIIGQSAADIMYLSGGANLGESGGHIHHSAHLDFNHNFESTLHGMFEDINKPTNHIEQQQSRTNAEDI